MATTWNWDVLDKHLATDISLMTGASLPDVSSRHPDSQHWLSNYFLNSVLRAQYESPHREYAYTFLRRTMSAFEEYELARAKTEEFVDRRSAGAQPTRVYMSALRHWEQCVANAWQAVAAWMKLTAVRAFVSGHGEVSAEEKLNHIYNRSKHTDNAIAAGQMPERGPLAVWLTNNGLRSVEHLLTWAELVDVLDELAQAAEVLQDPELANET